jgi:hypothetical protein
MEQSKPEEVSMERYEQISRPHLKDDCNLSLKGWQVPLLHGVILMAERAFAIKSLSPLSQAAIKYWSGWCLDTMEGWGFTREELAWLNIPWDMPAGRAPLVVAIVKEGKGFLSPESREFFAKRDALAKYPSGIGKLDRGECPMGCDQPLACQMCHRGHLSECHYPQTCEVARCSHYDPERE